MGASALAKSESAAEEVGCSTFCSNLSKGKSVHTVPVSKGHTQRLRHKWMRCWLVDSLSSVLHLVIHIKHDGNGFRERFKSCLTLEPLHTLQYKHNPTHKHIKAYWDVYPAFAPYSLIPITPWITSPADMYLLSVTDVYIHVKENREHIFIFILCLIGTSLSNLTKITLSPLHWSSPHISCSTVKCCHSLDLMRYCRVSRQHGVIVAVNCCINLFTIHSLQDRMSVGFHRLQESSSTVIDDC